MLKARMLIFISIMVWSLFAGANGSSTVGTVIVKGLVSTPHETQIAVVDNQIYEKSDFRVENLEPSTDSFRVNAIGLHQSLLKFYVISRDELSELSQQLEKTNVGHVPGYYGWLDGSEVWVALTSANDPILLIRESADREIVERVIESLSH